MHPWRRKEQYMALIAGDVGGTKTILALYSPETGPAHPIRREVFPSSSYPGLGHIVEEFLGGRAHPVECAVFGVAGPVVGSRAAITNLPWTIDADELASRLGLGRVTLLNDLEAVACGIPHLSVKDIHTLNPGEPTVNGPMSVIAPGTGLGEAYLTWDGSRYRAHASEGGHCDFAPRNRTQADLLAFLHERFGHVSYERVCSGSGIPGIYAFHKERLGLEEPAWLTQKLQSAGDPTIVIRETAQDPARSCEICTRTMQMFVEILGAETGNLALKLLPSGGIFLAGGLPPRMVPQLADGTFLDAYSDKGRLGTLVMRMPVHIVLNTDIALLGAARYGMDMSGTR
jgi:glucokinase